MESHGRKPPHTGTPVLPRTGIMDRGEERGRGTRGEQGGGTRGAEWRGRRMDKVLARYGEGILYSVHIERLLYTRSIWNPLLESLT